MEGSLLERIYNFAEIEEKAHFEKRVSLGPFGSVS